MNRETNKDKKINTTLNRNLKSRQPESISRILSDIILNDCETIEKEEIVTIPEIER